MKTTLSILGTGLSILFMVGIACSLMLVAQLGSGTLLALQNNMLLFAVFSAFVSGLLALLFNHLTGSSERKSEIVYVEKQTIAPASKDRGLEVTQTSTLNIYHDLLSEVDTLIRQEEGTFPTLDKILRLVCNKLECGQGILYKTSMLGETKTLQECATYAFVHTTQEPLVFSYGEGLIGLAAREDRILHLENVPHGYLSIFSGLGKATPAHLLIAPLKYMSEVVGVVELASFRKPVPEENNFIKELAEKIGAFLQASNG